MDHAKARERVVKEALEWQGTPYHSHGRVKKVGCDCLTFVVQVYENAGVIEHYKVPYYSPEFHLHRNEEIYLNGMLALCNELDYGTRKFSEVRNEPLLSGDIVLFRFGRVFSHGAIITKWPKVIHSFIRRGVQVDNLDQTPWLTVVGERTIDPPYNSPRPMRFFRPKVWC